MVGVAETARQVRARLRGETPIEIARIGTRGLRRALFGPPVTNLYQRLDGGHVDYELTRLPGVTRPIRGPVVDRTRPYVVCIGAAQTFGRFCDRPFPTILAERLGVQVLNLGSGGVGPAWFDQPAILDWVNDARLVVVQVLSGRSAGNSRFDNSASGDLMGVRVDDGTRMRFEDFFEDLTQTESAEVIAHVVAETRDDYVRRMTALLDHITPPTVLCWLSTRRPDDAVVRSEDVLGEFPHLVDGSTMDRIRPCAEEYVEVVSSVGLPQRLWPTDQEIDGTVAEGGWAWNHYYPSPGMHRETADLLEPICRRLLEDPRTTSTSDPTSC